MNWKYLFAVNRGGFCGALRSRHSTLRQNNVYRMFGNSARAGMARLRILSAFETAIDDGSPIAGGGVSLVQARNLFER